MSDVTFPNFRGKHLHDAFFTPSELIEYAKDQGRIPNIEPPEGLILCYNDRFLARVCASHNVSPFGSLFGGLRLLDETGGRVSICGGFGIGAPAAATVMEELIALGVRRIVSIGSAGGLTKTLQVGDAVLCDRAIRDEGVSHHYLEPAKYAEATPGLTDKLGKQLEEVGFAPHRGTSWTIDTPFRETVAEARHYQQEGVLTVEMEAAALFSVAAYRGVEIASAFVISDLLADLVWEPQFHADLVSNGLDRLFEAALKALE
jgi:uridine phosphorylase